MAFIRERRSCREVLLKQTCNSRQAVSSSSFIKLFRQAGLQVPTPSDPACLLRVNPVVSLQGALAAANIAALMGAPDGQGAALKAWECHGGYEVILDLV